MIKFIFFLSSRNTRKKFIAIIQTPDGCSWAGIGKDEVIKWIQF